MSSKQEEDELAQTLALNFRVSDDTKDSTDLPHPRFSLYKAVKAKNTDQEERRRMQLEKVKASRYDYVSYVRRLVDDNSWTGDDENELMEGAEDKAYKQSYLYHDRRFKNQVMLSEWLIDVPEDFENEWLMYLCPFGKRTLVVATKGATKAYAKTGKCVSQFPSLLPGGNRGSRMKDYTVLDCIFDYSKRTYFVLDLICWNGHPVVDSETEFRFYWLQSKLAENPELQAHSRINPYIFVGLETYSSSADSIRQCLSIPPDNMSYKLDGLLFYHKRVPYIVGRTPLSVWLKAYMVPHLLNLSIHEGYLADAPPDFRIESHIDKVKSDKEKGETRLEERLKRIAEHNQKSSSSSAAGGGEGAIESLGSKWTRSDKHRQRGKKIVTTNDGGKSEDMTTVTGYDAAENEMTDVASTSDTAAETNGFQMTNDAGNIIDFRVTPSENDSKSFTFGAQPSTVSAEISNSTSSGDAFGQCSFGAPPSVQ